MSHAVFGPQETIGCKWGGGVESLHGKRHFRRDGEAYSKYLGTPRHVGGRHTQHEQVE